MKRHSVFLIFTLILLTAGASTRAAEYEVTDPACTVYVHSGGTWKPSARTLSAFGDALQGSQRKKGGKSYLIFKTRGQWHLSGLDCVKPASRSRPRPSAPADAGGDARAPSPFRLIAGLHSLKENLLLNHSGGNEFRIVANQLSLCVGGSLSFPLSRHFGWGVSGCGFAGISEAAESLTNDDPPIEYRVENASVFGVRAGPFLRYFPSDATAVGVHILAAARKGSWPQPAEPDYELGPTFTVIPAAFLEWRFALGRNQALSLQTGAYGSFQNLSWALQTEFDI